MNDFSQLREMRDLVDNQIHYFKLYSIPKSYTKVERQIYTLIALELDNIISSIQNQLTAEFEPSCPIIM